MSKFKCIKTDQYGVPAKFKKEAEKAFANILKDISFSEQILDKVEYSLTNQMACDALEYIASCFIPLRRNEGLILRAALFQSCPLEPRADPPKTHPVVAESMQAFRICSDDIREEVINALEWNNDTRTWIRCTFINHTPDYNAVINILESHLKHR